MKNTFFILLAFIGFGQAFMAQSDSTKIRFMVKGSDVYYVRFNGRVLPLSNIHTFPPGKHKIEIWSPKYKPYTTQLDIPAGDSINLIAELKLDDSFREYQYELNEYKKKQFWYGTAPVALFCISSISTAVLYGPLRNANEDRVKEIFQNDFSGGVSSEEAQRAYQIRSTSMAVSVLTQAVSVVWFAALRKKMKSLEKPIYRQQNPFTLDYFEITYDQNIRAPKAGLTLTF